MRAPKERVVPLPSVPRGGPRAVVSAGTQVDFALIALLEAGGADQFVDIEDIAVAAFTLAPHLFCWRKYPQYPSAEATRQALRDVERRHGQLLVRGPGGRTRRFNAEGLRRATEARAALMQLPEGRGPEVLRRPATRDLSRMEGHPAVTKWRSRGIEAVNRYDLADLLMCSPSADLNVFKDRLSSATAAAAQWGRDDLGRFLSDCIAQLNQIHENSEQR